MNWEQLKTKALEIAESLDEEYKIRLEYEISEIERQGNTIYWEKIVEENHKYDENPNGLVLPFLLGITAVDPIINHIDHKIEYKADYPDIDVDFIGDARPLIKEYLSNKYGEKYVCNVGIWQRYAFKLAIQDVARALGYDVNEMIRITKYLPDEIDDFTLEQILSDKEFEQLIDFYNESPMNKKIIDIAYKMKGLIKAQGRHAGGFIISSVPVSEYIPLTKKDDNWITEWTEGHSTQLSKFGFVKFDFLGLKTLKYLWAAKNIIREHHGIIVDWSRMDISKNIAGVMIDKNGVETEIHFDDEKCFQLIEDDRLETIFQFDTHLARNILRNGVYNFNDILVFTSLGRPGPLPYVDVYVRRRDGIESLPEEIHPRITKILDETLQVIVYQEQLTKIWKDIAGFSSTEAELARKAVAKKWADKLKFVEKRWMEGASSSLGEETARELYRKMESFGRYAFNKCLDEDTVLYDPVKDEYFIIGDAAFNVAHGVEYHMYSYDKDRNVIFANKVEDIFFTGKKLVFELVFSDGSSLLCTLDHKFMSEDQEMVTVSDLIYDDMKISNLNNLPLKIEKIINRGHRNTFNIEMAEPYHNYVLPLINSTNMIVSANSHAYAYSLLIFRTLFYKSHFPNEWWSAVLTNCDISKQSRYIAAMREEGVNLLTLDIDNLLADYTPTDEGVRFGLKGIKGVGNSIINKLFEVYDPPYKSLDDFIERTNSNRVLVERLIKLGAFDKIEPNRKLLWLWYNYEYGNTKISKEIKTAINMSFGWPTSEIKKEIEKLIKEYKEKYPKRNKIPKKILNWYPTTPYEGNVERDVDNPEFKEKCKNIKVDFEKFKEKFGKNNFSKSELLEFQKTYLSFTIDSQIEQYKAFGYDIDTAKIEGILECIINDYELKTTKNGSKFCVMNVTDGIRNTRVNIWEDEYYNNKEFIKKSVGVIMQVSWDNKYKSFSVVRGGKIRLMDAMV